MTPPTPIRRRCLVCAASFTPHPRKRAQAYCAERCRQIAYRRRRAQRDADAHSPHSSSSSSPSSSLTPPTNTGDGHEDGHGEGDDDRHEVHRDVPGPQQAISTTASVDDVVTRTDAVTRTETTNDQTRTEATGDEVAGQANDVQLCPHCRQPIALLTLILTNTAAHVSVPELPPAHQRHGPI